MPTTKLWSVYIVFNTQATALYRADSLLLVSYHEGRVIVLCVNTSTTRPLHQESSPRSRALSC